VNESFEFFYNLTVLDPYQCTHDNTRVLVASALHDGAVSEVLV
jgi:hypothetical protein